jgi:ribosomal protein S4
MPTILAMKERIQKVLANAGVASRRSVEQMVQEGRIAVNDRIVREIPVMVDPEHDEIAIDGEPVRLKSRQARQRYYFSPKKSTAPTSPRAIRPWPLICSRTCRPGYIRWGGWMPNPRDCSCSPTTVS